MALPTNIIALFCEDIRTEEGNLFSLIGVLPDHLQIQFPDPEKSPNEVTVLPKLGIYVRIAYDPDLEMKTPTILMTVPGAERVRLGGITAETIERGKSDAKTRGNPLAGVVFRATTTGFRVPRPGVLKIEVQMGETIHLAGALNFAPLGKAY